MMNSPPDDTPGNPPVAELSPPEKLWTTKEVARFLDVSLKTVFNLRKKGFPLSIWAGLSASFRTRSAITLPPIAAWPRTGCGKSRGEEPAHDWPSAYAARLLF
jgi:hypothetical protein